MKLFVLILFSAFLLGFDWPAVAEQEAPYFARVWQAEDGLPDNRVVGVVQSADGFLWIATQNALVRFDGVRFQRVGLAESPDKIAGTMRILMLDRRKRIWLAKEEGDTLFCFDGAQLRILSADQGLPDKETQNSMAMDNEGGLWVAYTTGKVIRYNPNGKVDVFTTKDGLPSSGVCWLVSDRDGTLWFAKGSHVGVFRNGRFNVLENFGSSEVRITAARSGGIWICAGQQVLKFDESAEMVELGTIVSDVASSRSSFEPSVLLEDREGAVWVGTSSSGLFHCDSNAIVRVKVSNPAILSLAEDGEANLWVGTRGGLNQVRRRMISTIKSSDGLPFEGVQSVCQDMTGALWAVGDNGVLARGSGTNWAIQSISNGSVQPYVICVATDTNGAVWIGTRAGGLFHWANSQFKDVGLQADLHEKSLRSLLVMSNGDLWIGVNSPEVLYRLRGDELKSFDLPAGHRYIRAMAEDASGNFWAGASDGLLVCVTGETLVDETVKSSSLSIRCLHGSKNGDLWIGYAGAGAGRLRNGQITRFSTEQGLPNDYVAQILTDNCGNVWFAGNQGIFRVREQDFDDVAEGVSGRVWPVVYGRNQGLVGLQASFDYCPASARVSDDRLFFSMLSGLAEVRLNYARLNYMQPNVLIEGVAADGQTFAAYQTIKTEFSTNATASMELSRRDDRSELRLPPGLQQVQFEFTALSFVAPENVQFRYQLEGLDKSWVDAGTRRVANYAHPPPGHFYFKVIACNNDGIWNPIGDILSVTFKPHFWETLWFRLTASFTSFVTLCGLVVLVLRRRHRLELQRVEHQRVLELERTRIARDLHDDLGVGLTEIGLLGDLAGNNTLVPETSRQKLQEITNRARILAASLDEIVWAINPANDTSQSLMEYFFDYAQKLLEKAGIRCRLELIEPMPLGDLSAENRHEVFHAFKEALNNIIRHSGASEVRIRLSAVDGDLLIRVADNGRGFIPPGGDGSHDGMAGMRGRLQRSGGRCEIDGTSGSGTTVTFIIPMKYIKQS